MTRRHLFSSLGFYERSASAACSRRAAHALRRLGFRFLKESESDLLDARSGLWSAAFSSREESKSRLAARPPRRFFLVRCSDILSDSSPSTDRSPASFLPLACANTALCSRVHRAEVCSRVHRAELQLLLRGPAKSTERKLRACHLLLFVCARAAPRLAEGFMPVAPARAVTTWSTLRARFYSPSTHTGLQLIVCARAAPRLAEGFMPVAPARAVTARSTLRAFCVRPPAPAPASIAGIQQPPKCSSNSGLSIPVKLGLITCEVWVVELDDPEPRQSTQRERVRVVVG